MFLGEFQHTVDAKGRMILPAKFRDELGERFIVTKGLDQCLFVFPMKEWAVFENKVKDLPISDPSVRKFVRFFFGGAFEAETDAQGRIVLPPNLREYAGIQKDIIIVGVAGKIELWSKENWTEYSGEAQLVDNAVALKMAEFGI
ncbi:MAG: division/cell wall cluster transcriptional repressor MraZ [Clostridiales bacterium]|nr:division/cell wall cluster transcriptional repressor MraZ [Clostridiales bacterium]